MEKIKVFLSDPQVLFREGIHFILSGEDDFEVIGETTSNEEACTLIEANPPNIAILSMQDGKLNGPDVTRRLKRRLPSISVILTIDKSDEEQLFSAMKSGASACLTKDTDPEYLLDLIRVIAQGSQPIIEELLIPGLASRVLAEFEDLATLSEQLENLLASLAPKENEVLDSIAAGNGIEQVAAKLDINEETVRRNLRSILNKLVANDQSRSLIEAAQRSLPSIIRGATKPGGPSAEYVTKAEFNEFKESLMERLKSFIGELA
jgi:DNA-binding NarL/FixJ family response regulator